MSKREFNKLASQIKKRAKSIPKIVSENVKELTVTLVTDLVVATPVDTTEAISNWQVGVGRAETTSLPPHFPGLLGSTWAQSSEETVSIAKSKLRRRKPGETVYITNTAKHIYALNYSGRSSQAEAFFFENTVRSTVEGWKFKWKK